MDAIKWPLHNFPDPSTIRLVAAVPASCGFDIPAPSWLCCAETPVAAMRTWGLRLTQPIFLKEDWLIVKRKFLSFDRTNPQEEDWVIVERLFNTMLASLTSF